MLMLKVGRQNVQVKLVYLFALAGLIMQTPAYSANQILSQDIEKALHKQKMIRFRAQKKMDEIYLATENSFLPKQFQPLEGAPVLVAVQVTRWDKSGPGDTRIFAASLRDIVEFKVIKGAANLVSCNALDVSKVYDPTAASSISVATELDDYGLAWVIPAGDQASVEIEASLQANGARLDFVDPNGKVKISIGGFMKPVGLPTVDDIVKAEFNNKKHLEGKLIEQTYSGSGLNAKEHRAHVLLYKGKNYRIEKGSTEGVQDIDDLMGINRAQLDASLEGMPRRATHRVGKDTLAVLKKLGGGYVFDIYDLNNAIAGPNKKVSLTDAAGNVLFSRMEYSAPFSSGGYYGWGQEVQIKGDPNWTDKVAPEFKMSRRYIDAGPRGPMKAMGDFK